MTPEDRAKQLCGELTNAPYKGTEWIEMSSREALDTIAAAIRAAENDALERAAIACDTESHSLVAIEAAEICARAVRSLKHKEVT